MTRVRHPAVRPPGALTCPLKSQGGQRGARAKFGHILYFLVLEAVQRRDACGDILARSGQPANIQRPCRTLLMTQCMSSDVRMILIAAGLGGNRSTALPLLAVDLIGVATHPVHAHAATLSS